MGQGSKSLAAWYLSCESALIAAFRRLIATLQYVGIGGHSSFGGYGFFSRKAGLLLDTVQSAEVSYAIRRSV